MHLRPRLLAIAQLVEPQSRIVDVGTDHAYLPVYLVQVGTIEHAIAVEIVAGPLESARQTVKGVKLQASIQLRLGSGLKPVMPGEVDGAIIAGMGGKTIIGILEDSPRVTKQLSYLVLQPMTASDRVRRWLQANGYAIVDELLVEENGIIYEVIKARHGYMDALPESLYTIGPIIWEKKPDLLEQHLRNTIRQMKAIKTQMGFGKEGKHSERYKALAIKIKELEEYVGDCKMSRNY